MDIDEIIEKALEGDSLAVEALVKLLRPLILSNIKKYGGLKNYDEDAYSEGVLIIIESLTEFSPHRGIPFLGFVKVKMKHYYQNRRRKKGLLLSLDQPVDKDGDISHKDLLVDKTVDIPVDLAHKEEVIHMKEAINHLSPRQKAVIVYYYFEGKTLKEIARLLGVHHITVAKTKANALKKLCNKLKILR